MAKHNRDEITSELGDNLDEEVVVAPIKVTKYNSRVLVQSLFPATLKYLGPISGEQYTWMKAGDTVSVNVDDVPELLSKRIGSTSCCGNSRDGNIVFQVFDN